MEASLVHTHFDTSKIDPFNGTFFKRWWEMIFSISFPFWLTQNQKMVLICYQPRKLEINKLDMLFWVPFLMSFLIFIVNLKL